MTIDESNTKHRSYVQVLIVLDMCVCNCDIGKIFMIRLGRHIDLNYFVGKVDYGALFNIKLTHLLYLVTVIMMILQSSIAIESCSHV